MEITIHAYERAKERLGLDKDALKRLLPKIEKDGLKMKDLKGKVKKYMDSIYLKEGCYGLPVIYGQHVYIFSNDKLVTVWPIPNELKNYKAYLKKKD